MKLYKEFWSWFKENQKDYYSFVPGDLEERDRLFHALSEQLSRVHQDLTFEFSPVFEDGHREFVISAGGIRSAFPAVEALCSAAPTLPNWKITAFRPRRQPLMPVRTHAVQIEPRDVHYCLFRDGRKVGIMLFHKDYSEHRAEEYGNALFLLLDSALGEYDVETKVGFIEFYNIDNEFFRPDWVLPDLATHFDEVFAEIDGTEGCPS